MKQEDETRGKEVGKLLEAWRPARTYPEFLKLYRPEVDPFVHEVRVHLFCRDYNLGVLHSKQAETMDEGMKRARATTAYREHQIIRKYFPNTLANSRYDLPPEIVAWLTTQAVAKESYVSPVSRSLITRFSEFQLCSLILALIAILIGADILLGRSARADGRNGE